MEKMLDLLSQTNYWEKDPGYELGLIRNTYLSAIINSLGNRLIKVLAGQRRTGKSYLVRQLIDYLIRELHIEGKNIFYLNKELYEFESIKTEQDLFQLIKAYRARYSPKGKVFYFIDEVQDLQNWEKPVVSISQDPSQNAEIFITGSNSSLLSGELATKLAGRYVSFGVFPFTWKEFLEYHGQANTRQNFIDYLRGSGLPEALKIQDRDIKRFYFKSLKDTILLQDIMNRYSIRDAALLEDLFLFVLHNVGNLTSIPSIIKYFKSRNRKTDYSTLSNYLTCIENSFIIHSSRRYQIKNKETLSGERKYYVNDLGFRNYLYPSLENEIASGLENIVYIHLLKAGYEVHTGCGRDFEIDFLAVKPDTRMYVQVTYMLESKSTVEREFGAYDHVRDFYPKYVLSMDEIQMQDHRGIKHLSIWDFLYGLEA
jgi:predicted AAA+ superfamily ATPase